MNSSSSRAWAALCRDSAYADLVAFDAEWVAGRGFLELTCRLGRSTHLKHLALDLGS